MYLLMRVAPELVNSFRPEETIVVVKAVAESDCLPHFSNDHYYIDNAVPHAGYSQPSKPTDIAMANPDKGLNAKFSLVGYTIFHGRSAKVHIECMVQAKFHDYICLYVCLLQCYCIHTRYLLRYTSMLTVGRV
jgi:hypothetical protein